MAFGARLDEGWRLCHRKGRSIYHVNEEKFPDVIVEFRSQAKAKACADEMNERWDEYWKAEKKKAPPPWDLLVVFLDLLLKYDGIALADYEEIMKAYGEGP